MWRGRVRRSSSVASGGDRSSPRRPRTAMPLSMGSIPLSGGRRRACARSRVLRWPCRPPLCPLTRRMPLGKREGRPTERALQCISNSDCSGRFWFSAGLRPRPACRPGGRWISTPFASMTRRVRPGRLFRRPRGHRPGGGRPAHRRELGIALTCVGRIGPGGNPRPRCYPTPGRASSLTIRRGWRRAKSGPGAGAVVEVGNLCGTLGAVQVGHAALDDRVFSARSRCRSSFLRVRSAHRPWRKS
jgi:hypothetical protein